MREWTSESLWGIRTAQDIKTGIEALRWRRARSLSQIARPRRLPEPGPEPARQAARVIREDHRRFARQERAVIDQQRRMLAARAELERVRRGNQSIQLARSALALARRARIGQDRAAFRRQRRRALAAAPDRRQEGEHA
jgi:hypothetical protein